VLLTGQSYSVSSWVKLGATDRAQTVVSQDSTGVGAFNLGFRPANGGQWVFDLRGGVNAGPGRSVVAAAPAVDPAGWHHVVGVLDRAAGEIRLNVDGVVVAAVPLAGWKPWQAAGPLQVGREKTRTGEAGWLTGAVDDLFAYQSALSGAQVAKLYAEQHIG
jgi:alpha-N-arabinofuranosidase